MKYTKLLSSVGIKDISLVGGKNASLGEMIVRLEPMGVKIPHGFIVTAEGYRHFLKNSSAKETGSKAKSLEKFLKETLHGLDTKNLLDLARRGKLCRDTIRNADFPEDLKKEIISSYKNLEKKYGANTDAAVRSSATAEDLPGASFAGEHETYLNIRGEEAILRAVRSAMASLFTDRAISYRVDKGFDHLKTALSVGVQKMVRSDLSSSGVMFTLDTESGFPNVIIINGSWGLGEMIVQGEVTPDEFLVFKEGLRSLNPIISKKLGVKNQKMIYSTGAKPTKIISTSKKEKESFALNEKEVLQLAKWGLLIEEHYSRINKRWTPMDMEWAKDGRTGELYIVQARPETIHATRDFTKIKEYVLDNSKLKTKNLKLLARGASVGNKIAAGKAHVILDAKNVNQFKAGEILVTDMTDPDWEPIMKIASAIVTDKGGRTSHAAIVSRELGIPCVVGTEVATRRIKTGQALTVDTTGSEGMIYEGILEFKIIEHDTKKLPRTKTHIMMNIATPDTAFLKSFLPNDGVGLAREEFIIASDIGVHPLTLINFDKLKSEIRNPKPETLQWRSGQANSKLKIQNSKLKRIVSEVEKRTAGWENKEQFYIDKLAYGIAKIGAAFYPKPVIVRFSDFKTNEYRTLVGGELYEPEEENPMIGWRGASRYYHPKFAAAFALECKAIKKVREEMGLTNVKVMIPFCRTVDEGKKVLEVMAKNGLARNELEIFVMCEIPSNVVLAEEFLNVFDGMSIGSNDLTQLTVGIDRDAGEMLRGIADERDESVKKLIAEVIKICKNKKKYVGICGDAPSTFPEFAEFLVKNKIESISLNPDAIIKTTQLVSRIEKKRSQK